MATADGDAVYDFYCEFCKDEGYNNEAVGFCVECDAYLCDICIIHHRRNRLSRHHVIQDKETMPSISANRVRKDISTTCLQHKGELVRFYCKSHDVLICSLCAIQTHIKCTNIDIIVQYQSIFNDSDYKDFIKQLNYLMDKSNELVLKANNHLVNTECCSTNVIGSFKLFKKEIESVIADIENSISDAVEKNKRDAKITIENVLSSCKSIPADIGKLTTEFEELEHDRRACQAFIRMKEVKTEVKSIDQRLQETEENNKFVTHRFVSNHKLKKYFLNPGAFATLIEAFTKAEFVNDINVKTTDKGFSVWITGSAVMSDIRLIAVDHRNCSIKLVDTSQNKVISELNVQGDPWDVTVISANRIAVTICSKNKIVIFYVTDVFRKTREINVDGKCLGICYSQNQLIVSFVKPPKLELISPNGNVARRIYNDNQGHLLFIEPHYVCASNDGETIYVSDSFKIMSLTKEGKVKSSFKEIERPEKVCVDQHGNLFVGECGKNIHMLTAECNKIETILTEEDGLNKKVFTVSYCRQKDRLYVGMNGDVKIKVYQLS